jgi:hypothetical protein
MKLSRRQLLQGAGLTAGAAPLAAQSRDAHAAIDFRYSPLLWQTAYCFPDDPHKSLAGERGELRYGHPGQGKQIDYFPLVVDFSLSGMDRDTVAYQRLEAPGIPIIHTRIDRPQAIVELTTFATNRAEEGRVDNVILEVRPRNRRSVRAQPIVRVRTRGDLTVMRSGAASAVTLGGTASPFLVSDTSLRHRDTGTGFVLSAEPREATGEAPLRLFFRFPQQGQNIDRVRAGLAAPDALLEEARRFWRGWSPFQGGVSCELTGRYHEFLIACARNIMQAREVRNGRLTFQVGPTVYRGLWVVDGHFLLEAARYLGYEKEAQQGLEATWALQEKGGGIFAGAGREHWKDTGIAMFTLVRLAELGQDWSYFRKMQPEILRGVGYLSGLREKARAEGSANGRYGLLARGMGDGGLGGIRSEFTNTLWALAGLRAVTEAAARLNLSGFDEAKRFHDELRAALFAAARQEMRTHPRGFDYLPMLMREDQQWSAPNEWDRPRPQVAQWALSHAIYPGLVFEKNDPIVQGHVALMQACTQEDVPAETGWIPHEGLWTYNAMFAAHAYLWAGRADWARLTFHGFLNHATPLYCWREEQPLAGSVLAPYVGDMPHNWASAECILFLRHMLALEDGSGLRLLAGVGEPEACSLSASPTRFGPLSLSLEPLDRDQGWRLKFDRGAGPEPARVELPRALGMRLQYSDVSGAKAVLSGDSVLVSPEARSWSATWKP